MSQVAPAGWYADPLRRGEMRYWDGSQWTAHVARGGEASTDDFDAAGTPLPPPSVLAPPTPPPPPVTASAQPYTPAYAYGSAPAQATVAGLAIASMVLGIVWIYWIGSILAIIFGHVALRQIRNSNGWKTGRGMAIAGVTLGYVGLATLVIFIIVIATARTTVSTRFHIDGHDGVCNNSRYLEDPDCG